MTILSSVADLPIHVNINNNFEGTVVISKFQNFEMRKT